MSNAVLTITCPNCGGKVSGVLATNVHQTVPCTYCRTELHVPRVGEVVVREIVHERVVVQQPAFEQDLVPNVMRYPPRAAKPGTALAIGMFIAFGAIVMLITTTSSHSTVDAWDQQRAAEQACKDSCPQECIHSADNVQLAPQTDDPELKKTFAESDELMRDTARTMCTSRCEVKCMGIDLDKR